MAYAAVISLKQTIKRLLNSSHYSIFPPSRETIRFAYEEVLSLQEVLRKIDNNSNTNKKRLDALDKQIRNTICTFEDLLEVNISNQLHSQSNQESIDRPAFFSLSLQEVEQDINSFMYSVYMLKEEYINELSDEEEKEDGDHDDGDDDNGVGSRIDPCGENKSSKMVGLSEQYREIRDRLVTGDNDIIVSLFGMAGIGKTTLAKEIFKDPMISNRFECRAWVAVGREYQLDKILKCILAQVNPDVNESIDELSTQYLSELFNTRTHLIVLDDIWCPQFIFKFLHTIQYESYDRGRFLITTRLQKVATRSSFHLNMRLLNKEESWNLLREKVFSQESLSCPPGLEKDGKKIAENCDGLPLTIVTVAKLLSRAETMTQGYWKRAAEVDSSIFTDAYDQISKVLLPSYKSLSQHLKACFLYMGVLPQYYKIRRSELIKLWSAEGFLEPIKLGALDDFAVKYLKVLVSRSLVMVCEKSLRIKTCRLHSVFWHLCKREARRTNFFYVLNRYADSLAKGLTRQRRLCIHNNILFTLKDVHHSIESISTTRSLLCFGTPLQYQVPICSDMRLLRVLDALTIRFYEFPIKVLKLLQLRYLALTYNGNLPRSISQLWNLLFLIVHRNPNIKSSGVRSYLPMEIWNMKELKHLQIMGSDLPDPRGTFLPNLLTLLDMSPQNCTRSVLEGLPNLKKLGIRVELAPDTIFEHSSCFERISHLHLLESLKCVVVNPEIVGSQIVTPLMSKFPTCLKRLTLTGLGRPWEDMRAIASLPELEVLKLRCYAFRGPKWETKEMVFLGLKYLLIEDADFVHWTIGDENSFPMLKCLGIKHCYQLQEIPEIARCSDSLRAIEIVDCNPLAVACAAMQREKYRVDVSVHSSWE